MPRSPEMTSIALLMTFANRQKINDFAEKEGFVATADYIRNLIQEDMKAKGVEIDLSVNRGGYRIRSKDSE